MSVASDRIAADIACIDTLKLPASLVSTQGSHCDVWQTYRSAEGKGRHAVAVEWVIKHHRLPCNPREIEILIRDYRTLRRSLKEIIPPATYIRTRVNDRENVVVVARVFTPWFNLANPANEQEAVPLLSGLRKARIQLARFVDAAKEWRATDRGVIDLYGLDNLVLDKNREVRYLDSFGVFFHEDLLHILDVPDWELEQKIALSLRRLDYLEYLLRQVKEPSP